eukprot:SAG31_NODE_6866_length_1866_cov_1.333899_3_plen_87_part_00
MYGDVPSRLAQNMAGIFGPDNNKVWFDNFTIGQYIADMEAHLPFHAFNAYDQVNAATTIVRTEGLMLNTLKNLTAAKLVKPLPTEP